MNRPERFVRIVLHRRKKRYRHSESTYIDAVIVFVEEASFLSFVNEVEYGDVSGRLLFLVADTFLFFQDAACANQHHINSAKQSE